MNLTIREAGPLIRNEDVPDLPGGTVAAVFDAESAGDTVTLSARAEAVVAELLAVEPFDPGDPENAAITENLRGQLRGGTASDMLNAFTAGARNAAGVSVNQTVIDQVLAQFQ